VSRKKKRLRDAVRDPEYGLGRPPPDRADFFLRKLPRLLIERGERLVHQQYFRLLGERTRNADTLLHSAGKLVGIAFAESGETDLPVSSVNGLPPKTSRSTTLK
jgi:hypothetical protein